MRCRKAKRARRKASSPVPVSPIVPSTVVAPAARTKAAGNTTTKRTKTTVSSTTEKTSSARPKANLQRNPSILGAELPAPQPNVEPPAVARASQRVRVSRQETYQPLDSPVHSPMVISPYNITHIPPATPQSAKPLRRARPTVPLPRASFARKISFGALATQNEENHGASGLGLESAFQMH
jgi:hypothetical protein